MADTSCQCTEDEASSSELRPTPRCECPRDHLGIVIHEEPCLMYKHERIVYPHEVKTCECDSPPPETPRTDTDVCKCCSCPIDMCLCRRAGHEALEEWRNSRPCGAMPAVLEASHPLMQRFQETLKHFLDKENAIADDQLVALRDELNQAKLRYDKDLESIYRDDHDTNNQRVLIEEYEATLAKKRQEREELESSVRDVSSDYKKAKEKLDSDMISERETTEELEALNSLVSQLEKWREETESDLTISHRMSEKMRNEKKQLADEKRQLDVVLYGLANEVWRLESKVELYKKQLEIKNRDMVTVKDRVTAYATELEDLDLDKRRLTSLWNSVVVNIKQRDKVFDSVRDDYYNLQENYRTLTANVDITKKSIMEAMERSKELSMTKDKIEQDTAATNKLFEAEDTRRLGLETHINQLTESIEMTEKDIEMVKMDNQAIRNNLNTLEKEMDRRAERRVKLEQEILTNLQECLLNDKAVQHMASAIKKMRLMSTKLEISLIKMENQHAKIMLDIEGARAKQLANNEDMEKCVKKVQEREKELDVLHEKFDQRALLMTRKQRELDLIQKKYNELKELFDLKSPQERRIMELEAHIKNLRDLTETMQHEWLRQQGHVVKLTQQHNKIMADINLLNNQKQICEQKKMFVTWQINKVAAGRVDVGKRLRSLQGQLEVLERTRKDAGERNQNAHLVNMAITHEYAANLKGAESEIIELEEEIEAFDQEKGKLTQDLDRVQREALIWQRKGILAVELKRNIKNAQSAAGEIGQMKTEIHRMEVRREQLRRTSEKLSEDLAQYVTRRDNAIEKTRATAAVEAARARAGGGGSTSQSAYHHKLRLAKADVTRVTKELADAKELLETLKKDYARLTSEVSETSAQNSRLEERVATLLRDCSAAERTRQKILERVVRNQYLAGELATAVKRQSVKVKKPKADVITEYEQGRALNDRIRYIVECLKKDYPHLDDTFDTILNTLDIYTPSDSPRLVSAEEIPEREYSMK